MRNQLLVLALLFIGINGCAQKNTSPLKDIVVGGQCEGCEAIFESAVPFAQLNEVDTLSDFVQPGPKLEVSGIIYQADGKTPAAGVIMYFYHTDQKGVYPTTGREKGWAKRHGYLRGWVKTDNAGRFHFFTLRPASYPDRKAPAHIHATIKEPGKSAYWIDEFLFADDPLLPADHNEKLSRGGSGVLKPVMTEGILRANRAIILGLNIPGYPDAKKK